MFRRFSSHFQPIAIASFLMLTAGDAAGQQLRATVTGTVTDPQGAVVPGVTVTALNTDTKSRPKG